MCNCKNPSFRVESGKLYVWDVNYNEHIMENIDFYSFCPICGENLKLERLSHDNFTDDEIISMLLKNVAKMPHRYRTKEEYNAE